MTSSSRRHVHKRPCCLSDDVSARTASGRRACAVAATSHVTERRGACAVRRGCVRKLIRLVTLTRTIAINSIGCFRTQIQIKARIALYELETHHRATERHLPYAITQCYLPPDTGEHDLNPSHAGRYSIYLPRRDGRLS